MNTAPITSWEGAEAYFTFADQPGILIVVCVLAAAVCLASIASMIKHENVCSKKIDRR